MPDTWRGYSTPFPPTAPAPRPRPVEGDQKGAKSRAVPAPSEQPPDQPPCRISDKSVPCIILYNNSARALTFQNFCQAFVVLNVMSPPRIREFLQKQFENGPIGPIIHDLKAKNSQKSSI